MVNGFRFSKKWEHDSYDAMMGVLVVEGVDNVSSPAFEAEKAALSAELAARYDSREAIRADAVLQAYARYYKQFKKNYHVFFQIESVALKGKPIPRVNALVEAMFMAELKDGLLTAGHDLDAVEGEIIFDCARGDETYTTMGGEEKTLKESDLYVRDAHGILSSIIYGPDARTRITKNTRRALFTTYAVDGITEDATRAHLGEIARLISIFSPAANVLLESVYRTGE